MGEFSCLSHQLLHSVQDVLQTATSMSIINVEQKVNGTQRSI